MSWLDTLERIRTKDFKKLSAKEREKAARDVINMSAYACAVVAVSPVPFSDALLMLPIQSAMAVTVAHVYGRRLSQAAAKDLLVELGTVAGASFLARQGIKAILPVFGALLTVPAAFAANWAIGRMAIEYFKRPDATREYLGQVYAEAKREAGSLFSRESFHEFRKKNEDELRGMAEEEPAPKRKKKRAVKKTAAA
ncbi:MAG: YcjF family protein [Myxococcota bacterium]